MDNENTVYEGEPVDFDDLEESLEEEEPKKRGIHPIKYFREHPGVFFSLLGSVIGVGGTVLQIYANKKEYDGCVYATDQNGRVMKIPAKEMKTITSTDFDGNPVNES